MKLSKKDIVQRRVDLLAAEGIKFVTNAEVGKDISAQDLYDENDAVLLCMGATRPRDLPIPGKYSTFNESRHFYDCFGASFLSNFHATGKC